MWISWKLLLIPLQIYRATPLLFLLFLESPELHGVVWGCFSRISRGKLPQIWWSIFTVHPLRGQESFPSVLGMAVLAFTGLGQAKLQRQGFLHFLFIGSTFSSPKTPAEGTHGYLWKTSVGFVMLLLKGSSPTPQSPFSQVLELQWDFKHFSSFQQVKALAVLCQAGTEQCLWSALEKTLLNFPSHQICCTCSPWFCMGGNGAYPRAGAPWVSGAPLGIFPLEPSERCLIEILSSWNYFEGKQMSAVEKKVLLLPGDFFPFKSWSEPEFKSLISC